MRLTHLLKYALIFFHITNTDAIRVFISSVTFRRVCLFANRLFQVFFRISKMGVALETSDMILTKEQTEHINFRHIEVNDQRVSKFKRTFNLTATLALLTRKTWVLELEGNYEIIDRGFKHGHGEYIYVFRLGKEIGYDPYGFPSREIRIYFSWKAKYGDKLAVISAYPFSRSYHDFLKSRRLGFC